MTEKVGEKHLEKRRALGRGIESLLPSVPRPVAVAPTAVPPGTNAAPATGAPLNIPPAAVHSATSAPGTGAAATDRGDHGAPASARASRETSAGKDEDEDVEKKGHRPHRLISLKGVIEEPWERASEDETGWDDDDEPAAEEESGGEEEPISLQASMGGTWTDVKKGDGQVEELDVNDIAPSPFQARQMFDDKEMRELENSISASGIVQPIVVRHTPGNGEKGKNYTLITGERRLRAATRIGYAKIPAVVRRVTRQQAAAMTVVENLQRQDLTCMEQAMAFVIMSAEFRMTQEKIGEQVGVSRETVSNYMRLMKLPQEVKTYLYKRELDFSRARVLLQIGDAELCKQVAAKAVAENLPVGKLEELVFKLTLPSEAREKVEGGARWQDPNVKAAQRELEKILGMRVKITDRKGQGKIVIEYGKLEDFDRVVKMLKGK